MSWNSLLEPEVLVFLIPIAAIVVGGIVSIVGSVIKHRERMSMIEQGIHPDHLPDEEVEEG